jgi:hypothetical protein
MGHDAKLLLVWVIACVFAGCAMASLRMAFREVNRKIRAAAYAVRVAFRDEPG